MALAFRFDELIRAGVVADLAGLGQVTRARIKGNAQVIVHLIQLASRSPVYAFVRQTFSAMYGSDFNPFLGLAMLSTGTLSRSRSSSVTAVSSIRYSLNAESASSATYALLVPVSRFGCDHQIPKQFHGASLCPRAGLMSTSVYLRGGVARRDSRTRNF